MANSIVFSDANLSRRSLVATRVTYMSIKHDISMATEDAQGMFPRIKESGSCVIGTYADAVNNEAFSYVVERVTKMVYSRKQIII